MLLVLQLVTIIIWLNYSKKITLLLGLAVIAIRKNVVLKEMFDDGKTFSVTSEMVGSYTLNGNVLKYEGGDGYTHIFYKGKNY